MSLEVVDWGGSGRPLVFLAGGGRSTAHVFDDFAPRFTDNYRAIGITRRGNGGSSAQRPRHFDDYVDDIAAVLEAMKLESAVLIGHSFAGLEMARFGERYASRCAGLVYLDAAYDYTDPALGKIFETNLPPSAPPMQSADSASIDAVRAWFARTQGFRPSEASLRATKLFGTDGRLIGDIPSRSSGWNVESPARRWEAAKCRSIGIYAMPAPFETWLPYWSSLDSLQKASAQSYHRAFAPWTERHRKAFGRYPQNRVVEFASSNHYFFLEKPAEAEQLIRTFLVARE